MEKYQKLVQEALLGVVRSVLKDVSENGLQGEQHFFITFRTQADGVHIPKSMKERYPDEMTIVLQHQFDDLKVEDDSFSVLLSFSGKPERLIVPFKSLLGFVDPSEQFALQFTPALMEEKKPIKENKGSAEIIDLASLRNKKK
ncbi:MAG: hypothetical protein J6P93_00770 [Alphaproteobacteria bacterium]|nr:hypothetical protein [Alphaproteobacteria bacterium]